MNQAKPNCDCFNLMFFVYLWKVHFTTPSAIFYDVYFSRYIQNKLMSQFSVHSDAKCLSYMYICGQLWYTYIGQYTVFHQHLGSDATSASFALTDHAGMEPCITCALLRYTGAQTQNKHWFYMTSLPKYWWNAICWPSCKLTCGWYKLQSLFCHADKSVSSIHSRQLRLWMI